MREGRVLEDSEGERVGDESDEPGEADVIQNEACEGVGFHTHRITLPASTCQPLEG